MDRNGRWKIQIRGSLSAEEEKKYHLRIFGGPGGMGAPWPFGDSRYHLSLAGAYRSAGERRWGRTGQADFMFFSWWASVGMHGFLEDFACQLVFDICDASFSFRVSFTTHLAPAHQPMTSPSCKTCEHMSPQGLGSASGLAIEGRTSEAWQVGGCWTESHESHEIWPVLLGRWILLTWLGNWKDEAFQPELPVVR